MWTRLQRSLCFDASPWLRLFRDEVRLPSGVTVDGYYQIEARDFAMVFALTHLREVLCLRGYKYALNALDIQLPAGYLEGDEDPLLAAKRELLEETGYEAESWQALGRAIVDGNRGCGRGYFYLARGARYVTEPNAGDLEDHEVLAVPLSSITSMVGGGTFRQQGTLACIALGFAALAEED
ncbi:MAG: NUDIX hydrolase [Chloroflexi bacterium]|nr:NUDIX hydrolase [Chloroflexota bacterium]